MASGATLSWETLPEELLWMIFKHLTLKCLVSCMTVNRRWKDIALDFIESHSLWPMIATETMVNKGRTFKRKSVLGFKDMLMNSLLWPFVPQAEIKLHHTYPQQDITSIQVLKESMIMTVDTKTTDVPIKYFDIPNRKLQRGLHSTVRNSDQRVKVCQEEETNVVWLECADMTCATEHGEVLFMGYKDGSVAICSPHTMTPTNAQLDRLFNVREFDKDIEDPTILAVEVFEDKLSHHLLVATQHKVLQFLITYPDHIRSYFD